MYSVFLSKIELGMNCIEKRLKEIIKKNYKVAVFPWAFKEEIDSNQLINEYFKAGSTRYNRYIDALLAIGILKKNITICDCYNMSHETLKKIISESDVLLFPGGNPEMLFQKIVHDTELLYDLKYYQGIIIGESAGALLQLKRYFITRKNNFYKYFAYYEGLGVFSNNFYLDVHSTSNNLYQEKLKKVSKDTKKSIYAIYDDGAVLLNRNTEKVETFGHVEFIK